MYYKFLCNFILSVLVGTQLYLVIYILYSEEMAGSTSGFYPAGFIFACLAVPIVEEFFFRFLVLNIMRQYIPVIMAVVFSIVFFAWFHVGQPVFILSIVAGIVFMALYFYLDSILYPIIAHITYNSFIWWELSVRGPLLIAFCTAIFIFVVLMNYDKRTTCWPVSEKGIFNRGSVL